MLVKFDVSDTQRKALNIQIMKELYPKYGYKAGKKIKPKWVEQLMCELDPYKYLLEWDVQEVSLGFVVDLLKVLKASNLEELTVLLPNGKFTIKKGERAVEIYDKLKEEL
ncbi:MAG: hypothetical protein QXQ79_01370 [Candidatus Nanoarchaeia archaeon]